MGTKPCPRYISVDALRLSALQLLIHPVGAALAAKDLAECENLRGQARSYGLRKTRCSLKEARVGGALERRELSPIETASHEDLRLKAMLINQPVLNAAEAILRNS